MLFVLLIIFEFVHSQKINWQVEFNDNKAFVKNVGQFNTEILPEHQIPLYAYDGSAEDYYFVKDGIIFRFKWIEKENDEYEREEYENKRKNMSLEEYRRKELEEFGKRIKREYVTVKWIDINDAMELIPENQTSFYYSYTFKKDGLLKNENYIYGYEKLVYKNIYKGIDLVYEFNPQGGLKYSLFLKPYSDPTNIKFTYSNEVEINEDKLYVKCKSGIMEEKDLVAFYKDDVNKKIPIKYVKRDKYICFELGDYDRSKEIVIDPWVVTPFSTYSNGVWECETDAAGNVYIIGDGMIDYMKLKKYNSNGDLQWTYTTQWDTANCWLGTLATDLNGNSYITSGSSAEIEKINTNGSMLFHADGGLMDEYWAITFNCDQTKLIVGGTRLEGGFIITGSGVLFDINTTNGNVLGITKVGTFRSSLFGMANEPMEVRSITSSYNAKYYYITLDTIGAITQNFSQCPDAEPVFERNLGYSLGYKSENFRPETGNGPNTMIKANKHFVYTMNGEKLEKRSLQNGQVLQSVNIPGGSFVSQLNTIQPNNNGIDLDSCGNVYVGSTDRIVKYTANLTEVASSNINFKASDVAVGINGAVIVCGTTGSSGDNNRKGYVASVDLSACPKISMECCDANICASPGPMCVDDPPITLTPSQPGGIWSGPGITDPNTGIFNPSVAGEGTHIIKYTLPCGSDSIYIFVSPCYPLEVCYDQQNNNLHANGGSGQTINWYIQTEQIIIPQNQQQCEQCGGQWFFGICTVPACTSYVWTSYATGNTADLPSSWPLMVSSGDDTLIFYNLSSIPTCDTTCTPPTFTYNVVHQSCEGINDGSISLTMTSSGNFTFQWSGPNGFTSNQQNINNLAPGTYYVTVTNTQNSLTCTSTATIIVNAGSSGPTPTISGSTTFCSGSYTILDAGPGYASYLWSNGQNSQTIQVSVPGPYSVTVTDQNGCTGSTSVVVSESSSLTPQITGVSAICSGQSTTLDAGSGFSFYNWNTGATTQTIVVSTPGTYSVTVGDNSGCTGTASINITVSENPMPIITGDTLLCSGYTGTLNAGDGFSSYLWSNGQTTQEIQVNIGGTYSVTVTNSYGCTGTDLAVVNIVPSPTANAGQDKTICGLSTNLGAIPSTGIGTWSYFGSGTATFSNINDPQSAVSVNMPGTYYFIWTETANSNCFDSDTVLYVFNEVPTSSFVVSQINCMGETATVTYTGNATSNASYLWNWGGANVNPGVGPGPHIISFDLPGTYLISLQVIDNDCESEITTIQVTNPPGMTVTIDKVDPVCHNQNTGSINLTVNGGTPPYYYYWSNGAISEDLFGLPAGLYTVTIKDGNNCSIITSVAIEQPEKIELNLSPSQYICLGTSAIISASVTGGTPPYMFYWNNQPGGNTLIVTPSQTTSYTVYVVDNNGCQSEPQTTTVYVSTPVYAELYASPQTVCLGDLVELTPVVWGGTGAPYTFYDQNGNIVTPPIYIYPNSSGYYWIKAEDACGTYDTAGVFINVLPPPPIDILADTLQGCVPLTVQFIEINPDNGQTYLWSFGDNSISVEKNPKHTFTSSGNYTISLTVTSLEGCKMTKVYPNLVKVWPKPQSKFTWLPENISEVYPNVNFINQSIGGAYYLWFFGDGDSAIAFSPSHLYPGAGNYLVELIAITDKGCKDTAKALIIIKQEYVFYAPSAFSPNNDKVNDYFVIYGRGILSENFLLQIYDRWGNIIWETDKFYVNEGRSEMWDGTSNGKPVPVGTYVWRAIFYDIKNRKHEETGQVIIIR